MFRNLKQLERRKKPYPSINQWCGLSKIRDGLDALESAADVKTNLKKISLQDFKCWGCIFELRVGCNTLEGKSNPHGREVNADVKIWFGIFGICQGLQDLNGSVFVILHHAKAAGEFEVVSGSYSEIFRLQFTIARNDSLVYPTSPSDLEVFNIQQPTTQFQSK